MSADSRALTHPPHPASLLESCTYATRAPWVEQQWIPHTLQFVTLTTCVPIPTKNNPSDYCMGSQCLLAGCVCVLHSPLCGPHPWVQNSLASPDITSTDRRGRRRDTLLPPPPSACCLMSITHCTHKGTGVHIRASTAQCYTLLAGVTTLLPWYPLTMPTCDPRLSETNSPSKAECVST